MHYIAHGSFSVIFTPQSGSGRAECECLWVVFVGFSCSFTCSCPRWFCPAVVHRMLENQYYSIVLIVNFDVRIVYTFTLRGKSAIILRYKVQSRTRAATAVRCFVYKCSQRDRIRDCKRVIPLYVGVAVSAGKKVPGRLSSSCM